MLDSSATQRWLHAHRGLLVLPFVVAYLALSVLATRAVILHAVEPIESASSDAPIADSALSLGGEPSTATDAENDLCVCF